MATNEEKSTDASPASLPSPSSPDEISINFSAVWRAVQKIRHPAVIKTAISLILLLIPLVLGIYIRAQPMWLGVTDDWARNSVDRALEGQLQAKVAEQYGNIPVESRQRIVDKERADFIRRNNGQYEAQVKFFAQQYKDNFAGPDGVPYLGDIDSYLWLRKAQNILDRGHAGTEIMDDRMFDSFLVAPNGDFTAVNWHPHFIALIYRFLSLFSTVSLMYAQFFVPPIIGGLATLFAFLVGKKLTNSFGGFFAAMIAAVNPVIVSRTTTTDSDSYTILFHFLLFWLFLQALTSISLKKKVVYASLLGLSFSVFGMFWEGWWYSFDIIMLVLVSLAAYYLIMAWRTSTLSLQSIRASASLRGIGLVILCVLLASFIFVSVLRSPQYYIGIHTNLVTMPFTLKEATKVTLWPNVYTTVAELNEMEISNIIPQMGSGLLTVLGFFGLGLLALYKRSYLLTAGSLTWYGGVYVLFTRGIARSPVMLAVLLGLPVLGLILTSLVKKQEIPFYRLAFSMLLTLWAGSMFYASVNGVRFVSQIMVGMAVLLGVAVGTLAVQLPAAAERLMQTDTFRLKSARKYVSRTMLLLVVVFFSFILIAPAKAGIANGRDQTAIFDDGWYNTMMAVKNKTSPDAIITSWWDFGHYFKAIGNRRVTFDGGTQNRPQAHWVGKILLSNDEDEALRILRMLNCGGNNAFDSINKILNDPLQSIRLTYRLLRLDKEKGISVLEKITTKEEALRIAGYLFCQPPQSIFITSEDMRGKAGVWSHFGSWDFERAKIWLEVKNKNRGEAVAYLQEEFNYTTNDAEKLYDEIRQIPNQREANTWISGWPNYFSVGNCQNHPNDAASLLCTAPFTNGQIALRVNKETKEAFAENSPSKQHPEVIAWQDASGFHTRRYDKNTLGIGVAIVGDNMVLSDPQLAASVFSRLFFFEGGGLKHFKLIADERSMTTGRILTWDVQWTKEWASNSKSH